jgi:hypothetical protein
MHMPVKRRSQHAGRSMEFTPQQKFGPAISEAAKLRYATVSAIKPPGTSRWSEARPR